MSPLKVAIPLFGKMSTRSFHVPHFCDALRRQGLEPTYFIPPRYFQVAQLDPARYVPLRTDLYDEMIRRRPLVYWLVELRRFAARTETTDIRFRDRLENILFRDVPSHQILLSSLALDALRHVPQVGRLAIGCERLLMRTHVHEAALRDLGIDIVLTPGAGSYGFLNEGLLAREAQRLGIPVVAAVTNFDNIVHRGYRGFMPDRLAVWSQQMADDAVRHLGIPARRIAITGPVQYDRYFRPLTVSRDAFLRSKGLDPSRQTIVFAGGVNITRYFEMYNLLIAAQNGRQRLPWNVVFRVYPTEKLLASPGWHILEDLLHKSEGVYLSNSMTSSSDNLTESDLKQDLTWSQAADELHALLTYGDVLINLFSTISLEAALLDMPTIQLGYDKYTYGHRYLTSSEALMRMTHIRRAMRVGHARVPRSPEELLRDIRAYLDDRSLDREQRRQYALTECGALDGRASERLAAVLQDCVAARARRRVRT